MPPPPNYIPWENETIPLECSNEDGWRNLCDWIWMHGICAKISFVYACVHTVTHTKYSSPLFILFTYQLKRPQAIQSYDESQ